MKKMVLFFLTHIFWFFNIPIISIISLAIFLPLAGFSGDYYFSLICHHLSSRSLHINGVSIWLCYRCLALWSTLLLGAVVWRIYGTRGNVSWRAFVFTLVLSFPLIIDGVTQSLGWRMSSNWLRVFTGSLMGFSYGFLINQRLAWETSQILERRVKI